MRAIIRGMPRIFFGGVPVERAGDERLAIHKLRVRADGGGLWLASEAFGEGRPIPTDYSSEGKGKPPPLRWRGAPRDTRSLALIVEDPDAPTPNPYVHWLLYGIGSQALTPQEALARGASQGRNSGLRAAWAPCAPPKGDHAHRYFFQLFALDRTLPLQPGVGRSALLESIRGHVLGCATLIGTYQR